MGSQKLIVKDGNELDKRRGVKLFAVVCILSACLFGYYYKESCSSGTVTLYGQYWSFWQNLSPRGFDKHYSAMSEVSAGFEKNEGDGSSKMERDENTDAKAKMKRDENTDAEATDSNNASETQEAKNENNEKSNSSSETEKNETTAADDSKTTAADDSKTTAADDSKTTAADDSKTTATDDSKTTATEKSDENSSSKSSTSTESNSTTSASTETTSVDAFSTSESKPTPIYNQPGIRFVFALFGFIFLNMIAICIHHIYQKITRSQKLYRNFEEEKSPF
ncbi:hypothetical protein KGF56_001128 [Candida oxycetoniae]|uniref:Uncharacterized protein n=1 Tax=Candida oxycetoniae TaxID=497107 RepID=A0AAI9T041_9ASCO|nr:uncharacterized protein KGF56_001128 [Candida oxycetoniae]KAI3405909.2 hypothetical protein KGF56_001128 [Candida oxycetoniae]